MIKAFYILAGHEFQEAQPEQKHYLHGYASQPPQQLSTLQKLEQDNKSVLFEMHLKESSIRQNFHKLFGGHECDILAKMIYLFLANGKDCIYISFVTFAESFSQILVSLLITELEFLVLNPGSLYLQSNLRGSISS